MATGFPTTGIAFMPCSGAQPRGEARYSERGGEVDQVVGRNATPGGVGADALPACEQPQRHYRLRRGTPARPSTETTEPELNTFN